MPTIHFKATLFRINKWTILRLPESESIKLPSRGQVMVKGTINGFPVHTALEPDGKWSHWLKINKTMQHDFGVEAGDTVLVNFESTKDWPEPEIPDDLNEALATNSRIADLWTAITPMARWDWIRWITGTKNPETRANRIKVSFSKLQSGEKRPCCFNRTMCTDPSVSKNGVLIEPAKQAK